MKACHFINSPWESKFLEQRWDYEIIFSPVVHLRGPLCKVASKCVGGDVPKVCTPVHPSSTTGGQSKELSPGLSQCPHQGKEEEVGQFLHLIPPPLEDW